MSIVASYLDRRHVEDSPIQAGIVGAGFMSRGLVRHITKSVPGIRVAAICNRTIGNAVNVYQHADSMYKPRNVHTAIELDSCVRAGIPAVMQDVEELTRSSLIEVIVDATGALEYGSNIALAAISGGKHLVSFNAELDATVGPILRVLARQSSITMSAADGDQPAVQMRLHAFARRVGLIPRVLGNIKGLHDVRRTPTTQRSFAEQWGQRAEMVTSFADGTKVNFEQCVVANAAGFFVQQVGMSGRSFAGHVDGLTSEYELDKLRAMQGVVDFVVGASPPPGVFCLAEVADPAQSEYLRLFKLGPGPLYTLYKPYHLCHLEVPNTIASVVGFGDSIASPMGPPMVEVCAVAKTYIPAGAQLDGCGGYLTYGKAMNAIDFGLGRFLPMGVAEGCTARFDIPPDQLLTYDDVNVPEGRTIDSLRVRQREFFNG